MHNNLQRNIIGSFKKDMYLSIKSDNNELDDYGNPVENNSDPIKLEGLRGVNYQPISARSDMEMFGDSETGVHKALLTRKDLSYNMFTEDSVGDLVYLNGASPYVKPKWDRTSLTEEPKNGAWANYEVNAVRVYNFSKHVYFVKNKSTGVL